jgi:hypothetical protein
MVRNDQMIRTYGVKIAKPKKIIKIAKREKGKKISNKKRILITIRLLHKLVAV